MGSLSVIDKLNRTIRDGKKKAKDILNGKPEYKIMESEIIVPNFKKVEVLDNKWRNQLYHGDNLIVIKKLLDEGYRGKIDLIYIDPPFFTKSNYIGRIMVQDGKEKEIIEYPAYSDNWDDGLVGYLKMLYIRLYLMRELLSDKGSIYVHLDYRTVHYVKILMDEIFGEENFLNEIIWAYKSGGVSKRYYARKHDNILVYSKGKNYIFNPQKEKSYNRGFKPYGFKNVEEFQDQLGWYTLVNLKDVWNIDMVGRTSKERVGYDTQKPEALLERIIYSSSKEDSIVADFFAGSGTFGIVAEKLKRKWIMSDIGSLSLATINKRLIDNNSSPYSIFKTGNTEGIGRLFIDNIDIIGGTRGAKELNIELKGYDIDIDKIGIKDGYKYRIKRILSGNSLALVDFIGMDLNYDYGIPIIDWMDYRDKDRMIINPNIRITHKNLDNSNSIYIKCVDVFGTECSNIFEINSK